MMILLAGLRASRALKSLTAIEAAGRPLSRYGLDIDGNYCGFLLALVHSLAPEGDHDGA